MSIHLGNAQVDVRTRFGLRVLALRQARGWSQKVLAGIADRHRHYIGYVERGEVNPGLHTIESLADAFGLTISQFLDGV